MGTEAKGSSLTGLIPGASQPHPPCPRERPTKAKKPRRKKAKERPTQAQEGLKKKGGEGEGKRLVTGLSDNDEQNPRKHATQAGREAAQGGEVASGAAGTPKKKEEEGERSRRKKERSKARQGDSTERRSSQRGAGSAWSKERDPPRGVAHRR